MTLKCHPMWVNNKLNILRSNASKMSEVLNFQILLPWAKQNKTQTWKEKRQKENLGGFLEVKVLILSHSGTILGGNHGYIGEGIICICLWCDDHVRKSLSCSHFHNCVHMAGLWTSNRPWHVSKLQCLTQGRQRRTVQYIKKGMCMQTFSPATSFRALHQASLLPEQILNNFVINSFPDVVIHHYIKRPTVSWCYSNIYI